jgi:hypothetical protein
MTYLLGKCPLRRADDRWRRRRQRRRTRRRRTTTDLVVRRVLVPDTPLPRGKLRGGGRAAAASDGSGERGRRRLRRHAELSSSAQHRVVRSGDALYRGGQRDAFSLRAAVAATAKRGVCGGRYLRLELHHVGPDGYCSTRQKQRI